LYGACTPCTAGGYDEIVITFQKLPTSNAGSDAVICEDGSYTITDASVADATGQEWSGGIDGSFDNVDLLLPTSSYYQQLILYLLLLKFVRTPLTVLLVMLLMGTKLLRFGLL